MSSTETSPESPDDPRGPKKAGAKGSPLDRRMRVAFIAIVVVATLFTLGGAAIFGLRVALSVAIGGFIAASNLYVLTRIVSALVREGAEDVEDARRKARVWGVIAVVKLFGLFGGVYVLIHLGLVDPLPLVVGFGAMPIGIVISSLVGDRSAAA